uniref:NADP-dependent oxidoreductase domain-containing protein n=1 Tax=Haptolina brevifila TaxID=156173 RepID=A0A7S2GWC9_9EUKA|mmetsp:Transcript_48323/g.96312  ORF Transcript_48323/g.96312 Transcript_48323/m.96312 type:complete len:163 (+) Transcript_48323:155-643(+)
MQEQWKALTESHLLANKTRALGVSNFCKSSLACLAKDASSVVPAVNQFKFHIGMGPDPSGLVSYCKAKGIVPQAYSPLGDNTTELINGPLVSQIGAAHGKSGVQVSLRWIYQNGLAVTTKSGNAAHLADDADLFSWSLTEKEMATTDAANTPSGQPSFICTK